MPRQRRGLITFRFDRRVIRQLQEAREMERAVDERAALVEAAAQELAPERSGDYKAGIHRQVVKGPDGFVGQVEGSDFKSHWIEFGTAKTPARAPLRRALEAVFGDQIGEQK